MRGAHRVGALELRVGHARADLQRAVAGGVDAAQLFEPADVHEQVNARGAVLEHVEEALAPRQRAGVLVLCQRRHGVGERVRSNVVGRGQEHLRSLKFGAVRPRTDSAKGPEPARSRNLAQI
jgi:hypothetical protein